MWEATSGRTRTRRWGVGLAASIVLALAASTGVQAITFGERDHGRHPATGALIAEVRWAGGAERLIVCSGGLIAHTAFVTAGHCTLALDRYFDADPTRVWVSFDEEVGEPVHAGTTLVPVTGWSTHPDYVATGRDPDVAVVFLAEPAQPTPLELPHEGLLDDLKRSKSLRDTLFTNAGYGMLRDSKSGRAEPWFDGNRWTAISSYNALTKTKLHLSQNPSKGDGGTCYGDSGSPQYLGAGPDETTTIVSLTSTGDIPCRATNVTARMDTPTVLRWLRGVLTSD